MSRRADGACSKPTAAAPHRRSHRPRPARTSGHGPGPGRRRGWPAPPGCREALRQSDSGSDSDRPARRPGSTRRRRSPSPQRGSGGGGDVLGPRGAGRAELPAAGGHSARKRFSKSASANAGRRAGAGNMKCTSFGCGPRARHVPRASRPARAAACAVGARTARLRRRPLRGAAARLRAPQAAVATARRAPAAAAAAAAEVRAPRRQ